MHTHSQRPSKSQIFCTMAISCGLLMSAPVSAWANSLCRKGEAVYFSCEADNELIAVCASQRATQYRSGTRERVEFTYPSTNGKADTLFYSEAGASRYQEKHLRFDSKEQTYLVFDRWTSDVYGKSEIARGVLIFKRGAVPLNGSRAEFNMDDLIENKRCKRSTGIEMRGSLWINLGNEDFTYVPQ